MRRHWVHLFTASILVFSACVPSMGQIVPSFGRRGGGVSVERDSPPTVNLENTRINLEVNTVATLQPQYVSTLKTRLTTAIQTDSRFIMDPASANAIVRLTVTTINIKRTPVNTSVAGKQVNMVRLTGDVQLSFQVIDTVSKRPLDSANLQGLFDRSYVSTPAPRRGGLLGTITDVVKTEIPSDAQVLDSIINDVTLRVTRRMARTKEVVDFGNPGGDLKKLESKAKSRQWVSLYDDLDVMAVPRDLQGQAERQYWMGVAKEAQAYETDNRDDARKSLLAAVRHYQDAGKIQTDKAEYGEGARRAEESIVLLAGPSPTGNGGSAPAAASASRAVESDPGGDVLTNDHVIQMVKSGMDQSLLLDVIADHKNAKFDLTPNGLIRLSQEKVPANIIQAMRKKAQ